MELRRLRYFVAVAEAGHITRAAALLGIQQPPLSLQIKALENELGLPLLKRHPKGVSLTDGGRALLADARRLLADAGALHERMRRLARGEQGRLSVAFTSSAAAHAFTPDALRACRARYPDLTLELSEANAAEITAGVADARWHCGLLRVPVASPDGVTLEHLLDEPAVLAVPLDHALARGRGPVALATLKAEGFVLVRRPGAPGLYANFLALCEAAGFRPRIVAEVERMATNLNLVAAGAGVSVVPASMQGTHAQAVAYRPLRARLDAPLTLVYRADDCIGPTARFVALLRELARSRPRAPARRR